jgi:terminase small subunit-like protein
MDDDDDGEGRVIVLDPKRSAGRIYVHPQPRGPTYSEELAAEICETLAGSELSIDTLCKANKGRWPGRQAIWKWTREHPEFADNFLAASQYQCEMLMDKIPEIALDRSRDMMGPEGKQVPNPVAVQRDALIIKGIVEYVKKKHPYRWGDKLDIYAQGAMSYAEQVKQLK